MYFFLEYLSHFTASEILEMYGEGAFRTCEEIKAADFAISLKIIFQDDHISAGGLEKYQHMQRMVDVIRSRQQANRCLGVTEESCRYFSADDVLFKYFVRHYEAEKEVVKFNAFERKVIFSFRSVSDHPFPLHWIKEALEELLSYVLRDTGEDDRIGLVIKYEDFESRNAAFPIKFKDHLKSCLISDTLQSLFKTKRTLVTGQRMNLQVVRVRVPVLYRQLTVEDITEGTRLDIYDTPF